MFSAVQHPKSGLIRLFVEVFRSHTHTQPVGLLWRSGQLVT